MDRNLAVCKARWVKRKITKNKELSNLRGVDPQNKGNKGSRESRGLRNEEARVKTLGGPFLILSFFLLPSRRKQTEHPKWPIFGLKLGPPESDVHF